MSDSPNTSVTHPSGMRRMDFSVWVTDDDLEYITGAIVERDDTWEEYVRTALINEAAR